MGATHSSNGLKVGGVLVLIVVGVLDLAGSPDTLVGGVVNEGGRPLALVVRVLDQRLGPGATAGDIVTLGVGDGGGNPVTILLVIPVLGLLSLGVGNNRGLIDKPVLRLSGLLVDNLERRILIPVLRLDGIGVSNASLVNPILGLGVLGVINLLGRVDRGSQVLEKATSLGLDTVLLNGEGVVGVNNESVQLGSLDDVDRRSSVEVLLLVLASLGVLVVDNEVNPVVVAALVGAKHDDIGGGVAELVLVESLVVAQELHVGTTAVQSLCTRTHVSTCSDALVFTVDAKLTLKLHLVLNNEGLALVVNLLGELGRDGVVSGGVLDDKTLVALNSLVLVGLLNSPLANVGPFLFLLSLVGAASVLLGVRRLPSRLPVIGELLQEVRLDGGRLRNENLR